MPTNVNCTQAEGHLCTHPAAPSGLLFGRPTCIEWVRHPDPRVKPGCAIRVPYCSPRVPPAPPRK